MRVLRAKIKIIPCLLLVPWSSFALTINTNDWAFLDNGEIRIGVKRISGACIGWLSQSGSNRNVLNYHDQGRFVQQSFYGDADGTFWNKQPWRWNPVQGGDWKGTAAKLVAFKQETNLIYARSLGRHWSGCIDLPDVVFEEWLSLTGRVARVHYRMTYTGEHSHASRDHEIPAVFVEPDLDTLVLYDGAKPWTGDALSRSQPGWPNESRKMTENWAAYVDKNDFGMGALVSIATNLTCYRFGAGQTSAQGACSYFAPLIQFPVTAGKQFDYEVHLTIGTVAEIRDAFQRSRLMLESVPATPSPPKPSDASSSPKPASN
jgi:hypothetical protein